MSHANVHKDDIGTVFILQILDQDHVAVDVSTATEIKIYFKPVDGTTITVTGVLNTTGTDGKIKYVTTSNDGIPGSVSRWRIQAKVTLPSGVWHSSIELFDVEENLA